MFVCLWDDCGYECYLSSEMVRHINYHSFHSKIKSHGLNLIKSQGLKGCLLDPSQRNLFHDLAEPFKCVWGDCIERETDFDHPQEYYWHVARLVNKIKEKIKNNQYNKSVKEHLRSHTQEKLAGCPTCGCVFANRVKLLDHLKRQQCGNNEFTCTHCNKSFALERLLRDHMRSHINRYECKECGVTWPTPSSLQNHIKYRHSQDRDYSCDICEHKAKSAADLKQHLRIHQGDVLTCMEGCGFSCKSNPVMKGN
ncbi:histone H4 transcription factor [Eurytemora carolleeae]|uniref:histone H4 transcription factor n=1 Tax=Eurytemora carolleeae TaxID=1294199 RepID=UPI000C78DCAB|nr:histone H4 transcription factor [Eurytemora carolleeae]|eukprot:XP_023332121.1 histone H4 transcription factor-like [Eurytemora affinis]